MTVAALSRKRSREARAVLAAARRGRLPGFSTRSGHLTRAPPRSETKKQQHHALGDTTEFDEAKKRAEDWLAQLTGSPVRAIKRGTVIAGLESYLTDLRRHGRAEAAKKAEGQFKTALGFDREEKRYKDPIAALQLEEATKDDFLDWRDRLRPGRLPRTVNQFARAVTAGLNREHGLGHIGNPAAWRVEALADDESETAVFLSPAQRKGLMRPSLPSVPTGANERPKSGRGFRICFGAVYLAVSSQLQPYNHLPSSSWFGDTSKRRRTQNHLISRR